MPNQSQTNAFLKKTTSFPDLPSILLLSMVLDGIEYFFSLSCVPYQHLAHPQPSPCGGQGKWETEKVLDAVQELFKNSQNIGVLSLLFWSLI